MTLRQRWKQTSLPNKLLIITGALVAFGTVFYAGAAAVQIHILNESLRQSDGALRASIESSHNDQRAWIAIESMAVTLLEADKPLKTEVKIINTGKTIAVDVQSTGAVQTSLAPLDVDKFLEAKKTPTDGPGEVLFQNIDVTIPAETSTPLTSQQVEAIKTRQMLVYLCGDVHYKDIFKKPHTTQYCGIYVPATNKFEACHQHKQVD
jgi:hypothetical protein